MKKVEIKVGMSYMDSKGCVYATINEATSMYKIIKAKSPNESLILGIAEILKDIPSNCIANIYVQTNFGFKFMQNRKKWCNREAGDILLNIANDKNICLEFIDCSATKEVDILKAEAKHIILKETRLDHVRIEENIPVSNVAPKSFVKIFVRGVVNTADESKPGKFIAKLNCKGVEREIVGFEKNTTSNRMIMQGAIEAIKLLKHPCNIELHTHTDIGLEGKSKANFDLLHDLRKAALNGGHILNGVISDEKQSELTSKLKQIEYKK